MEYKVKISYLTVVDSDSEENAVESATDNFYDLITSNRDIDEILEVCSITVDE